MPLAQGMTLRQMQDYLTKDLRVSVVNDVAPCLQPTKPTGGYFAVPRLVLGYVDYLGALYHGYQGRMNRGRRVFAESGYAKSFLRDVFGQVDGHYALYGDLLWEIYRNGTIHLYQPLTLQNGQRVINWAVYKGQRTQRILVQDVGVPRFVRHLEPQWIVLNHWIQPVSITCLYEDILLAIDTYVSMISSNASLQTCFRQVANALQVPEPTKLTW
jgi:hypothetical protein